MWKRTLGIILIILGFVLLIGPLLSNLVFLSPPNVGELEIDIILILGLTFIVVGIALILVSQRDEDKLKKGLEELEKKLNREQKEGRTSTKRKTF